jgi:hypothetical protein
MCNGRQHLPRGTYRMEREGRVKAETGSSKLKVKNKKTFKYAKVFELKYSLM